MRASALLRGSMFNLVGQLAPLVAALVAFPFLAKTLGVDRLGFLSIAWAILGYFSLFDFGLGRAITQLVSQKIGSGSRQEIPTVAWTGLSFLAFLGMVGGGVVFAITPWLVQDIFKIPGNLEGEVTTSCYLLAFTVPFIVHGAGLRGILEAFGKFGWINAVRVPLGILMFLGPLVVVMYSVNLAWTIACLVVTRISIWVAFLLLCFKELPDLRRGHLFDRKQLIQLLNAGGWMTVSNIIGPLMVYFDRFLIGAMLSMAAVAYYSTPYEVVTKLWILPSAFIAVLFPGFAKSFSRDQEHFVSLQEWGVKGIFVTLVPISIFLLFLAPDILALWLGSDFSVHSSKAMQWLVLGVLVNSFAQIPFALLQAIGRSDITAKLHLLELPFYLVTIYFFVSWRGIDGAAIAWFARVFLDAILLAIMVRREVPYARVIWGKLIAPMITSVVAGLCALNVEKLQDRVGLMVGFLCIFLVVARIFIFSRHDCQRVVQLMSFRFWRERKVMQNDAN